MTAAPEADLPLLMWLLGDGSPPLRRGEARRHTAAALFHAPPSPVRVRLVSVCAAMLAALLTVDPAVRARSCPSRSPPELMKAASLEPISSFACKIVIVFPGGASVEYCFIARRLFVPRTTRIHRREVG